MDVISLKSGICPKCKATEVYTEAGLGKRGERVSIAINGWQRFYIDTYICAACGHFEEYIPESELKKSKAQEKLRKDWRKVTPKP